MHIFLTDSKVILTINIMILRILNIDWDYYCFGDNTVKYWFEQYWILTGYTTDLNVILILQIWTISDIDWWY